MDRLESIFNGAKGKIYIWDDLGPFYVPQEAKSVWDELGPFRHPPRDWRVERYSKEKIPKSIEVHSSPLGLPDRFLMWFRSYFLVFKVTIGAKGWIMITDLFFLDALESCCLDCLTRVFKGSQYNGQGLEAEGLRRLYDKRTL